MWDSLVIHLITVIACRSNKDEAERDKKEIRRWGVTHTHKREAGSILEETHNAIPKEISQLLNVRGLGRR